MTDSMVEDYRREVERLTAVWEDLKRRLKTEKDEAKRKHLRRGIFSAKFGRAELRKTLAYMTGRDRMRTDGRQLQTEAGDKSFLGIDGNRFWLE